MPEQWASLSPRHAPGHCFSGSGLVETLRRRSKLNCRYLPDIGADLTAFAKELPMNRILAGLAAAFFLMAASAQAQQPSRLDDIVKRGTLRVGLTGDYLPFSSLDSATSK
jgi:hypothetical protein